MSSFRHPYGTSQESNTVVMIHDAFQPISYWDNFMPSPQWDGVILDTHIYQMFSVAVSTYLQHGSYVSGLFDYRRIRGAMNNISRKPVTENVISPYLACWPLLESGPQQPTTVPNTLTVGVLALAMTEVTLAPPALAVALASPEMRRHSAKNTKISYENIGKPK